MSFAYVLVLLALSSFAQATGFDWVAFGDLRGHVEPCGCHPSTDLGGLRRIANGLVRFRAQHPQVLVFDLGNNTVKDKSRQDLIVKALNRMKPTVSLVNEKELLLASAINPSYQRVLSNFAGKQGQFSKFVVLDQALVLGFVYNSRLKDKTLPWSQSIAQEWQKIFEKHPKKTKVLLFSGERKILDKIIPSIPLDLILLSNPRPFEVAPDLTEKKDPSQLYRVEKTTTIRTVSLGGMGLLRGGKLFFEKTVSLGDLIGSSSSSSSEHSSPMTSAEDGGISWLDTSFEYSGPMDSLFTKYNLVKQKEFEARVARRKTGPTSSRFAGATACQGCHAKAYEVWSNSRHSSAHATLQKKGKEKDGDCVSCHVVGYDQEDGFVSLKMTPHLANIQCENCHGPRKEHASNPSKKGMPVASCNSCHHPPHTDAFKRDLAWKKIHH